MRVSSKQHGNSFMGWVGLWCGDGEWWNRLEPRTSPRIDRCFPLWLKWLQTIFVSRNSSFWDMTRWHATFLVISDILIFGWVAGVGAEAIRMKVFNKAAWVISKYHNGKHCLICPWQTWNSFLKQSFHCEFWARDCKLSVQVYEERKSFSNTVCNFPVKTISVLCPLKPTRNVSG